MIILFAILLNLAACQTSENMEFEEKQIQTAQETSKQTQKVDVDWDVILQPADQMQSDSTSESKVSTLNMSPGFEDLLNEVDRYLKNHETEYGFQILSQMKRLIERTEYPYEADIYMYEYSLARAYIQNENVAKARKILVKLTRNDQSFIPGYMLLAETYSKAGKNKAAQFILQRALEKNPNSTQLQTKMAAVMIKRAYYQNAYQWVAKALKKDPNNIYAFPYK